MNFPLRENLTYTSCANEKIDTSSLANQPFSFIDQAYEEALDPWKNSHAFISHTYPPPFIQVMEAFAEYTPLKQKLAHMDLEGSSSTPKVFALD